MKTIVLAGLMFMATSVANATTIQQLFLDAGGGTTAAVNVDDLGFVTCSGTCGGLTLSSSITPHTTLQVSGTLGQFGINITAFGGNSAIGPALQNLNQMISAVTGAGSLSTTFTDTGYCMGGGGCFAPKFVVSASVVNDFGIRTSTIAFSSFASTANAIPAGTFIGTFSGLTGLAASAANSFASPVGTSGSLTSATLINFSGAGTVQANLQISTTSNPGSSNVPTNKTQCMNGGWTTLVRADGTGFKNEGDCIQFVDTGK